MQSSSTTMGIANIGFAAKTISKYCKWQNLPTYHQLEKRRWTFATKLESFANAIRYFGRLGFRWNIKKVLFLLSCSLGQTSNQKCF